VKLAQRLLVGSALVVTVLVLLVVLLSGERLRKQLEQLEVAQLAREARLVAMQWTSAADADALADAAGAAGLPLRHGSILAAQAFELALDPPSGALVIGVSHEGGTWATNEAMRQSRNAGCRILLITVSDRSPGAQLADVVIQTREQDQSWCHTVGYLSPIAAATALAAALRGTPSEPITVRALLDSADSSGSAQATAMALVACDRLLMVGSGADYAAARELALKVEEGARLPSTAHQLETLLHGHLAAAHARTGLVLMLTDPEARGELVVERALKVLRAAAALGMPAAAILAADLSDAVPRELTAAGRLTAPLSGRLPRVETALIGSAIPLQLLAERLARARATNPDAIGRDDQRQAAAADA
jgi:fructoselysine-6-P-deglycase FrlB-like protein